jgi:flavin reductase (DIM6/NTAB) family NADH-FMN oxidoreductase RutF
MTAAWVMPVSSSPPLVALAVFPAHYSHDLIVKGGDFVLNIPARPLAEKVHRTAMVSGRDADKFLTIGLTPFEATRVNSPRIAECMAHLECGVVEKYEIILFLLEKSLRPRPRNRHLTARCGPAQTNRSRPYNIWGRICTR